MSIYKYFESKDGLIRSVVERLLDDLVERYKERFSEKSSFRDKLRNLLSAKLISIERDYWDVINEATDLHPQLSEIVQDYYKNHFQGLYSNLIAQGVEQGEVSPQYSHDSIRRYVSMYRDFYLSNPESQEMSDAERKDFFNFFWFGLRGE